MPTVVERRTERSPSHVAPAIHLLGGFSLDIGADHVDLPQAGQRLLALVALRGPITRESASTFLWPGAPRARAAGNLRSVLWRLDPRASRWLRTHADRLALSQVTTIDVDQLVEAADAVADPTVDEQIRCAGYDRLLRQQELLPDWFDDWVLLERERLVRLRLRALQDLAAALVRQGRFGEALDAGLEAVRCEPLSEAAHRAVLAVHVAEGNVAEARCHLAWATQLLQEELGVCPTKAIIPHGWLV